MTSLQAALHDVTRTMTTGVQGAAALILPTKHLLSPPRRHRRRREHGWESRGFGDEAQDSWRTGGGEVQGVPLNMAVVEGDMKALSVKTRVHATTFTAEDDE